MRLRGKYANRDADAESLKHLAVIDLAYEVLSDPAKRDAYDYSNAERLKNGNGLSKSSVVSDLVPAASSAHIATTPSNLSNGTESKWLLGGLGVLLVAGISTYAYIEHENEQKFQAEEAERKAESDRRNEVYAITKPLNEALAMLSGRSSPQNFSAAFAALTEIASQSTQTDIRSRAAIELGLMHLDGKGIPANPTVAASWFRKAISDARKRHIPMEQFDNFPAFTLGKMYETGLGVPKASDYAYAWFNIAAAQDVMMIPWGTPQWDYTVPGWRDRRLESAVKRDKLASMLSNEQLQRAQNLSKDPVFWGLPPTN